MEITQDIFGFVPEEEGEVVIVYTMKAPSGASVSVTNMGASLVSVRIPGRDGVLREVVHESAPVVVNCVWEARVEVNRVVFSTVYSPPVPRNMSAPAGGCGSVDSNSGPGSMGSRGMFALETAYHWSDECELEIVFSAVGFENGGECALPAVLASGLVPQTRFNLLAEDTLLVVEGWKKNILAEAGTVSDPDAGIEMTVLTSLPRILVGGSGGDGNCGGDNCSGVDWVCGGWDGCGGDENKNKNGNKNGNGNDGDTERIENREGNAGRSHTPGGRYIQKTVYKFRITP